MRIFAKTQFEWLMDPSLPEKLKISQLFAGNGTDKQTDTNRPTMHCGSATYKVDEIRRRDVWSVNAESSIELRYKYYEAKIQRFKYTSYILLTKIQRFKYTSLL